MMAYRLVYQNDTEQWYRFVGPHGAPLEFASFDAAKAKAEQFEEQWGQTAIVVRIDR